MQRIHRIRVKSSNRFWSCHYWKFSYLLCIEVILIWSVLNQLTLVQHYNEQKVLHKMLILTLILLNVPAHFTNSFFSIKTYRMHPPGSSFHTILITIIVIVATIVFSYFYKENDFLNRPKIIFSGSVFIHPLLSGFSTCYVLHFVEYM